jgi:hypothetical protein
VELQRAENIDRLEIPVGGSVDLESLRQAVVPPHLMLMPFLEVPDEISIEGQTALDEDGVHGCVYRLRAKASFEGQITIGFRDLQTGEVTHRKVITARIR